MRTRDLSAAVAVGMAVGAITSVAFVPRMPAGGVRVLVGPPVFKTGVSSDPAQAGSIPVRLRYQRLPSTLASFVRLSCLRPGTDAGTVLRDRAVQEGKQSDPEPRRLLAGQGLRRPRSADRQAALRVRPRQDQARGPAGRGGAQDQGSRGS